MRIRKNSKMSTALFLSSSTDNNLIICHLNQSPWDIITFPPPPPSDSSPPSYQLIPTKCSDGNGTSTDHPVGTVHSIDSLKLATEAEHVNQKNTGDSKDERGRANLCCKTNGKQYCKRNAQRKNNNMCNCHSANAKSSSNTPVRTRKPSTASKPNEFYYYAGFGPLWAKERELNKRVKEAVDEKKATLPLTLSSSSEINDDNDNEDTHSEDEEEMSVNGKKRRRRRIKARSLKDLCERMG